MAREEVFAERLGFLGEVIQVSRGLILIASVGVEVVHQHILLTTIEFEDARALYGSDARISVEVLEILLPRTMDIARGSLLDTIDILVSMLILCVALVEEMIAPILVDDVVINGAILGGKELLRLALESCEVRIGIGIVADEGLAVATL